MLPVIISIVVALVYLATEPKRYLSQARMTVTPAGSRLSGDASDNSQPSNFLYTQGEKIVSRDILAIALSEPIPDDAKLQFPPGKLIHDLDTFKDAETSPLTTMRLYTSVTVGKKDDALTVGYESPVKDEAPVIVNAIVRAFMKYQTLPKRSTIHDVLEAHMAEKQKIEAELTDIQSKMVALEQKYGILSNSSEENLAFKQLSLISQQLNAAHSATLSAKADFDDAARLARFDPKAPPTADLNIVSAQDETLLRADLMQLQGKLQDMRQRYLPDHPQVQAIQKKINQLAASYAESVRRRYLRAKAAEDDLAAQFDAQQKKTNEIASQAPVYARLKEDDERERRLLETIETRIHGIDLQQAAGAVDIDFFDPADFGGALKCHPSKTHALGLALVLGLLCGCGLALLRDWADDRLHNADDVKWSLGMPLLGAVPRLAKDIEPSAAGQSSAREPGSEVAEAYRSVRTAIYFGAPKDRSRTILITSPSAGDGKSTSAANLAAVMAQAGKRVLLVDADLRNPAIGLIFKLKESRIGLSSLLSGQGTWDRAIQKSAFNNLDLLPCGPKAKNPSELLNSPLFGELLEMLAEKYDQIIVDSPPVIGLADARIIAASTDLTLLVLRADKTTRKLALLARDGLIGVGAQVLGVIVNDLAGHNANYYGSANHAGRPGSRVSDDLTGADGAMKTNGAHGRNEIVALPKQRER